MSMYGIEAHICGVPCAMVLRGSANGHYQAVFERERASLEEIEAINWAQPVIEGSCLLPVGYGFTVEDISYSSNTRSYTVSLKVAEQFLGCSRFPGPGGRADRRRGQSGRHDPGAGADHSGPG